jgi:hypothetical protein
MKTKSIITALLGAAIITVGLASCGNNPQQRQADEQALRDSLEKVIKDSLELVQKENAEKQMQAENALRIRMGDFLQTYIDTHDFEQYLSAEMRKLVKINDNRHDREMWTPMWNTGSSVRMTKYDIMQISISDEQSASVECKATLTEDEEEFFTETYTFKLIQEKGKWMIDDIIHREDSAKADLKS